MRAKVKVDTLKDSINKILTVVDKKNTRPILTYTLIKAENNQLNFCATDLEVSAQVRLEAIVEKAGTFCVNAKNLSDILKELPNEEIELICEENTLKIECGDIHFTLLIYNSEDFPQLSFEIGGKPLPILSTQLSDIINKTVHAISTDETRLYLNGIYLQETESKLRAVATDGHRLSLVDTQVEDNKCENLMNGIIIPRKGVFELKKLSEAFPTEELKLSVDESFLYANANDKYFLSIRLIAREYPKYQAVIPSKTSFTMTTDKMTFFNAIRRIKIMSNEKSNGVRVHLKNNEMTIMANHPSLGDAREKINVDYAGKEMEIGFNAKYLVDTLATFDEGEISLELNNELSPVLIKSNTHPNYLGIIMPLKL